MKPLKKILLIAAGVILAGVALLYLYLFLTR